MHRSGEEVLITHIDVDRDYEIRSEVVANFDVGDKGADCKVVYFPRVEPVVDGRVSPRSRDGLVCALLDDLACFAEGVQPRLVSEVILASFFFTGPDGTGGVEDDGVQVDFCALFRVGSTAYGSGLIPVGSAAYGSFVPVGSTACGGLVPVGSTACGNILSFPEADFPIM